MDKNQSHELECVDSQVGDRILDLTSSALEADDRQLLAAHADVCAYCRLTLDLERCLGEGIRDGTLAASGSGESRGAWRRDWAAWGTAAAMAASLACLLILPPQPVGPDIAPRGPGAARFLQPVEGEVVSAGTVAITWTEIPGAESYRIVVTDIYTGTATTETTDEARLEINPGRDSGSDGTYRVLLATVPADLLPPGGASLNFRTGNRLGVISHRLRQSQPVTYWLALTSLGFATLMATRRKFGSRIGVG